MKTKNKPMKISVGVMIFGATIFGISYLPFMNPPQCSYYQPVEGGNCIIGANIGQGLFWALGISVFLAGCMYFGLAMFLGRHKKTQ